MLKMFSYSALDTFRSCPRKFKFQYVEKVDVPKKVNVDTYLGNAVHRVLRKLYQLGSDGVVMLESDMLALYHKQWETVEREYLTLTDEFHTVDDYIRLGEKMLVKHYERYRPFNQGTLLGAELHLTFVMSKTPFRFRAYLDRLWKRDDGAVEICDYKTGRHLARPNEPAFLYQMGLYQMAVQQTYPHFDDIELAQYFLRMDEVVRYRIRPDELESLAEELRLAVVQIHQAARLDNFPTREGPFCHYCDYAAVCPAKRHRLLLEKDEELPDDEESLRRRARELADQYLDVYQRSREAKAELDALKAELIQLVKERGLTRFDGERGYVSVKVTPKEKFVTKGDDAAAFAELSHVVLEMGLDEYFSLDTNALMKQLYQAGRLTAEQFERLKQFVVETEESRVTARLKRDEAPQSDPGDSES
ncbi:MAG: PD-(D/E)XK nuclease family protein [Candidatus Zixiibacteriota bacterium]